jgi:predicted transglutaminase-like cysteine proteinase
MHGSILAIGMTVAAAFAPGVSSARTASHSLFPDAVSYAMGNVADGAFETEAQGPLDVFALDLGERALFWRFDGELAYQQWALYEAASKAGFGAIAPVAGPATGEPRLAEVPRSSPLMKANAKMAHASDLDEPVGPRAPSQLARPMPHLPLASAVREGSSVLAPLAFVRFCSRYASQCIFGRKGVTASLDAETWALLDQVNRSVNQSIQPTPDRYESWDLGVSKGDCDDYAVEKRRQLIAKGLPAASLSLSEVVARGEGHLVLAVRTDRGTFILDNLRENVVGWSQTGYRFVKMQSLERPDYWVSVDGAEPAPAQIAMRMPKGSTVRKDAARRTS